ncbi:2-dehydro-3-deoxygalactonokinase [Paraburkholderia sp. HD33-4]|uniref:2-dehydro-3-deoxygalactonokinase n=1 Tax=Paraburkholderia sp. HD33-4 TaxID=2883242 RepID=UPI001F42B7D0|nr:2-dehydro-3-deoxygalactonokinase [Paraburkholderia sp. HD33-4]
MNIKPTDEAVLIGLDWGTSSLRAYLFNANGTVLDSRQSSQGIMHLRRTAIEGGFDEAFEAICGDWLDVADIPVVAAGMVGSAQGWLEAPYVPAPVDCAPLTRALETLKTARGTTVFIVPGIIQNGPMPNVMRGEETQIFGAFAAYPELKEARRTLIGLPGTHAKWAFTFDGELQRFLTFMTGEVFAVLRDYTILGRTMHPSSNNLDAAFLRGVDTAIRHSHLGVLATMFSVRTLGLTGEIGPEQQSDYLSGLLIGHELCGLSHLLVEEESTLNDWTVGLIGDERLCRRYQLALSQMGYADVRILQKTTEYGLFQIAWDAGLLAAPSAQD